MNLRSVLCSEWQCFEEDHNLLLHDQTCKEFTGRKGEGLNKTIQFYV